MPLDTARPNALRLHPADNVVVAMRRIALGEAVATEGLTALEPVSNGHKLATRDIAAGEPVLK